MIAGWEDSEFAEKFGLLMRMAYQANEALFSLLL
jgi:hypothetical protein